MDSFWRAPRIVHAWGRAGRKSVVHRPRSPCSHIPNGPSNTILLFECVQTASGGNNRNGSIYFGSGSSRYGATGLPTGSAEEYHQGSSDFLFCDAHVKALHPTQTWTSATDPQVLQYNVAYVNAKPGAPPKGQGTVDMWNPGVGGSVYP